MGRGGVEGAEGLKGGEGLRGAMYMYCERLHT